MASQALIELVPFVDQSKLDSTLSQLESKGTVSDGEAAAYKAGNAELKKRNDLLTQEIQANSKLESAGKKQIATLGQVQKAASAVAGEVIKMTGKDFQKAMQAQGKSAEQLIDQLAGVTEEVKEQKVAEESLRTEKRRLQQEIARLIDAGQQETEMFGQLLARAGQVDDAMRDATDAIARTGSDTRGLDTTIQLAQGVTAGFTIATSAAALFGDESEATQQVLLKVNAAMALLNGLQEIQNLLRSEYIRTLGTSITVQGVQNAQLAIENGLNSTSIIVRTGATIAQRLLNAAMAANPLGLMVVALAAVITAVAAYASHTADAAKKQLALNSAVDSATKGLEAELEAYDNFNKKRTAELEKGNARQSVLQQEELVNLRVQNQRRVDEYKKLDAAILKAQKEGTKVAAEDLEARSKLLHEINQANVDGQIKVTQLSKQILEEQNGDAVAAAENAVKLARNGSAAELAAKSNLAKVKRDIALKGLKDQVGDESAIAAQRAAIEADYRDTVEALAVESVERSKAHNLRRLAAEKQAIDNMLIAVREGSKQQLDIQEDAIRKQAEMDKASIDTRNVSAALVAKERQNIEERANQEINKLRLEFGKKQAKDAADIELFAAQSRVAAFREGTAEYYSAQRMFLGTQAQNEELAVQQSTESEQVKAGKILLIHSNLNKSLADLNRQQQDEIIARQQATIEALDNLALTRANIKASDPNLRDNFRAQQAARTEELRQIEEDRARIHQKGLTDAKYREEQYQTDLTNNTAKGEGKRFEIIQANAQREKEIRNAVAQAAFAAAQEAANAIFDSDKAQRDAILQDKLDQINKEKEAAVSAKNLTERQKSDIQKKYDQETRRLKNEAARKERKAAVAQAVVNGLLAVTNALATVQPFWAAIIAAAGAAITTGIQVAKINSAPLPAYEKGTKSAARGYALVGERGPEIVEFAGGERVWTHTQSDKMMKEWNAADHSATIAEHRASYDSSSTHIDYDELGKAVAKYMPKPASVHMVADKYGLTIFLQSEGAKQTIRNSRYSTS